MLCRVAFKQSWWHLVGGYWSFGIVDRIELWREEMILGESLAGWELRNEFLRQGFVTNPSMWGPVAGTGTGTGTLAPDLALRADQSVRYHSIYDAQV
jgi:hypothetical protein